MKEYDYLIVGSGFAGSVFAQQAAEQGKRVLILEQRDHIGGNCYDSYDYHGILIHNYGPHIFHTSSPNVYTYLSRFTEWEPYEHEVLGNIDNTLAPIPFNLNSLHLLFPKEQARSLENKLIETYGKDARVPILKLKETEDPDFKELAQFVYEKIFLHYTMKQWGVTPEQLDPLVTNRVPVVLSRDDRYFNDTYQVRPKNGFTPLFEKLLDNPLIDITFNTPAESRIDKRNGDLFLDKKLFKGNVIWTGPIDEFFDCTHGRLPYRTLEFKWEHYPQESYQIGAVVNYPTSEQFTRITEFKKLTGQDANTTTVVKEFPNDYTPDDPRFATPYYSVHNESTDHIVSLYKKEAQNWPSVHFLGRLGEYTYYNMDAAVLASLKLAKKLLRHDSLAIEE
ncbi:MAG: UDP-galactopyranose mutase [Fibrobacterales bacterium]